MDFVSVVVTLVLVLDPVGAVPVFQAVLARLPAERRRRIVRRELLIALAILLLFLLSGNAVLGFFGLRQATLSVSGGIILFLIALGMVFPARSVLAEEAGEEPLIVPLAMPIVAGPAALATLLLLASRHPGERPLQVAALLVAWWVTAAALVASERLLALLGAKGVRALERLMGMVLVMLAVQMFLDGLARYPGLETVGR
jgi:multiple antibiotic resistance protein